MTTTLSAGALAAAVTVSLLAFVGLLVFVLIKNRHKGVDVAKQEDNFITTRGTQPWWGIGLSLYAGAAGTWALTAPPETAITGGWWAHLGYVIGCGMPWLVFLWSGMKLRRLMGNSGRTTVDFVKQRYGLVMDIIVSVFSCFSAVMSLTAEYTAVSGAMSALRDSFPSVAVMIAVAVVTAACAYFGGMPFSMFSDKAQAMATILLVVVCYGVTLGHTVPEVPKSQMSEALSNWDKSGVPTGLILIVSCFLVEQANQATWQRVFAARSERDMQLGFLFGAGLMTVSMFIFGFVGFIAAAAASAGIIEIPEGEEYAGVFRLLSSVKGLQFLTAVFVMVLVTSTAVTVQAGLTASVNSAFRRRTGEPLLTLYHCRLIALLLNIPGIVIAILNPPSILLIYMIINCLASSLVPIVLLGFTELVTNVGAVSGICSGVLTIFVCGWSFTGTFVGGLTWITFPDGYTWSCFATFVIVPSVSALMAIGVSAAQFKLSPEIRHEMLEILESIKARDIESAKDMTNGSVVETQQSSELIKV